MKKRLLVSFFYNSGLKIGAWVGTQPSESAIKSFQELQGRKLDIVHQFINCINDYLGTLGIQHCRYQKR